MSDNISEYTPTWKVSDFCSRQLGNVLIEDELGKGVAEVYGKRELAMVIANLMAAAPDLLQACKLAQDYVGANHGDKVEIFKSLLDAISKAEGTK